jgi:demethylmenaquinone methyltransferase/2-methoxy-6-polyprenyl-1,4-benzoquinol methylase
MFDRIAPRYDILNRVLSGGTDVRWRRRAVNTLALPQGGRVLDVCSGTADLLLEVLGRDGEARGLGVDLSQGMLLRGIGKLGRAGLHARSALSVGDAARLPLASAAFDGALMAFGIRNVADRIGALREICRVLRPGGRLLVLEFSMPEGLFGRAYRLYFEHILPRIGALVSGDAAAYRYLPASVGEFPDPRAFRSLMTEAGFREVSSESLSGGIAHLYRGERA